MKHSFLRLLSLVLILGVFQSPLAAATETPEEQFSLKLEWGVFNPDGTPARGSFDPGQETGFSGDISFSDSIGVLTRTLNFERLEDQITSTSNTFTSFHSIISGGTDGLIFNFTGNFEEGMNPSLYYFSEHEGRNVTLPLSELMADPDQKLEYVIDADSRYKLFIEVLPAL